MLDILLLILCAVIFYGAAEMEGAPGILWAVLSVGIYLLTWVLMGWGFLGCIAGQVALFVSITVFKMLRNTPIA